MQSFPPLLLVCFAVLSFGQVISRIGNVTLYSGEDSVLSAVISPSRDYAYFVTSGSSNSAIVKVALDNFTRVANLSLAAAEQNVISAVISPSGDYAYFGTNPNPGRIVKVALN